MNSPTLDPSNQGLKRAAFRKESSPVNFGMRKKNCLVRAISGVGHFDVRVDLPPDLDVAVREWAPGWEVPAFAASLLDVVRVSAHLLTVVTDGSALGAALAIELFKALER